MKKIIKNIACVFVTAILLTACGAARTTDDNQGDVEDLRPGDKSVIGSPAPSGRGGGVEERAI